MCLYSHRAPLPAHPSHPSISDQIMLIKFCCLLPLLIEGLQIDEVIFWENHFVLAKQIAIQGQKAQSETTSHHYWVPKEKSKN